MSSFHVDGRVSIKLEYDLAMRLGEFILSSGSEDKQFLALGHKLLNIDEEDATPSRPRNAWESWDSYKKGYQKSEDRPYQYQQEKEIIRSAGKVLNEFHEQKEVRVEPTRPIKIRKSTKYYKSV